MTANSRTGPTRASLRDSVGLLAGVVAPVLARGVILRRPKVLAVAERLDVDRRAVQRLQRLRARYGSGPLVVPIPRRPQVVVLDPQDVHRVLAGSPEPFTIASSEKRAALSHFQPQGVLVSTGAERADRRRFNEAVLDTDSPVHELGPRFAAVVADETVELLAALGPSAPFTWEDLAPAWFRVVRRVVFGDAARSDTELTDTMAELRAAANWAFARPKRTEVRDRLYRHLAQHLRRAEPGSLAAVMATTATTASTEPDQQVPQWLFAFDAAAMATFRALALLASHPEPLERARAEALGAIEGTTPDLPLLRACVLESVRLWPTTPAVLRQTDRRTSWGDGEIAAGAGVLIFAPFFHRDDERLPYANRFHPDLWLGHRSADEWPLIPFSGGPGMCPGRNLVLLLGSHLLARVVAHRHVDLEHPASLGPDRPLPGTLSAQGLRFRLDPLS